MIKKILQSTKYYIKKIEPWYPLLLVLLFVTIIRTIQHFFFIFSGNRTFYTFVISFLSTALYFFYFFPLALLLRIVTRRYSLQNTSWQQLIIIHLAIFVCSFLIHQSLVLIVDQLLWNIPFNEPSLFYRFFNNPSFWIELIAYILLMLGFYVYDYTQLTVEREKYTKQLETELINTHLSELKNKLQPDILFGSLKAISYYTKQSDFSRALHLLQSLSEYLRITVYSSPKEWSTIGEEINFLETYLAVLSLDHNKTIAFNCNIENSSLTHPLPKFTLQPIVEIMLRHFQSSIIGIIVDVSTKEKYFTLTLRFETKHNLNTKTKAPDELTSIKKRLANIYHNSHCFDAKHSKDFYTITISNHSSKTVLNYIKEKV